MKLSYLFIALCGLSTSSICANPIVGLAQIPGLHTIQGLLAPLQSLSARIPGLHAIQGLSAQIPVLHAIQGLSAQIPGLHAIQGLLAPLGLINPPAIEIDTGAAVNHGTADIQQAYHIHESDGQQYPIVLDESRRLPATSIIAEQPIPTTAVVENVLKLIDYLWQRRQSSENSQLPKHKEIVKHDPIIIKQNVPVYITKHLPKPYPVQYTVVKEVKVPQPYPVTQTVVKEVKVPEPYPVTNTVVKEVKVPEPYPVTKTVVKEVKVPEPYTVTQTVVKEVGVPQPYPVQHTVVKEFGVPQPYPVTKTIVKEVPVIHKVKELVPFKISVPEPVAVPIIKTVKEHHLLQPIVKKKTVIEHHQHNEILTPLPVSQPEIQGEEDKALITPVEPITEKSIEIVESPESVHNEYGLPSLNSFQPFNSDNELPAHDTDNNTGFGKSNTEGEYVSAYVLNDGTKVSEEGHLIKGKMGNDVLVKKGNYEFTDKNGKEVKVDWVADELGFRILNQ